MFTNAPERSSVPPSSRIALDSVSGFTAMATLSASMSSNSENAIDAPVA